jgi:hypothetical protein
VAVVGVISFLLAKATPIIAAFAPFSYLVSVLAGVALAALTVGAIASGLKRLTAAASHHEPPPPVRGSNEVAAVALPEAADVTEAKLRLGKFVINELSPAITYVRGVLDSAGGMLQAWDPKSPQAHFARLGVLGESPLNPTAFSDLATIRSTGLEDLERHAAQHVARYMEAVRRLWEVLELTRSDSAKQKIGSLPAAFSQWFPMHQSFIREFAAITKDIHFPGLRAEWNMKVHGHNETYCAVFAACGFIG